APHPAPHPPTGPARPAALTRPGPAGRHRPLRGDIVRLSLPPPFYRRALRIAAPAVALLAACTTLAACGSSAAPPAASSPTAHGGYPTTVTSCGVPVTYDRAPTRAVSNDINATEDMLALGLESHMAGIFGATGDLPAGDPVPAPYLAGFRK